MIWDLIKNEHVEHWYPPVKFVDAKYDHEAMVSLSGIIDSLKFHMYVISIRWHPILLLNVCNFNNIRGRGEGVSALSPTPNRKNQGFSGLYPSTCVAWVALPVV